MPPSGSEFRAPHPSERYPAANLSAGVAARSSAVVDATPTATFETHTVISPAATTNSARLLAAPTALGDNARSAVAAPITTRTESVYEGFLKPVIDRVLASVLLIVFLPLFLIVAVMVALSLGWPIVLRQRRVGHNGETFVLHKFRTMHPDRRRVVVDYQGRDRRLTHKHPDDPRLTSVGRALRKWSLDELPQLWDVLTGKLSLVGPRPELEIIVATYEPWQHARHAVKPGLTGLWQVKARGDGEMHEHTDLDVEYARSVTLRSDLKIVLLTIPAILARKGY